MLRIVEIQPFNRTYGVHNLHGSSKITKDSFLLQSCIDLESPFALIANICIFHCARVDYLNSFLYLEYFATRLQSPRCKCNVPILCENCNQEMNEDCSKMYVNCEEEIIFMKQFLNPSLGPIFNHPFLYCSVCKVLVYAFNLIF